MEEDKWEEIKEKGEELKRIAFSFSNPIIVHHYDADGISAGAIVDYAFRKEWKPHRRMAIKKLDDTVIERLEKEREIIFVDVGSGNKRVDELKDVVVIDHHQRVGINQPELNPWQFGIDGGEEGSSSVMAYAVFKERADLAVVGAIGDMQQPFKGINRALVEEAKERGEIEEEFDLTIYGKFSRPLHAFLAYSDEPFIPTISYNEENALSLLSSLNIPLKKNGRWRKYKDLSEEEKARLIAALVEIMVEYDYDPSSLLSYVYYLPAYPKDSVMHNANEFATMLNACGRHKNPSVGVESALGNKEAVKEAESLLVYHKRAIREGIKFAKANMVDLGKFYFIDGRKKIFDGIIGIICGMVMRVSYEKPILGISESEEGGIKVSSRGNERMKVKGLNLGLVMREAAEEVGGVGGGHKLAAGAEIPKDGLNDFLLAVGRWLGKTLS